MAKQPEKRTQNKPPKQPPQIDMANVVAGLHTVAREFMAEKAGDIKKELATGSPEKAIGRVAGGIASSIVQGAVAKGKKVPSAAVPALIGQVARDLAEGGGRMGVIRPRSKEEAGQIVQNGTLFGAALYKKRGMEMRQRMQGGQGAQPQQMPQQMPPQQPQQPPMGGLLGIRR